MKAWRMRKAFDSWLIEWLDTRYYAARWDWTSRMWGKIALRAVDAYWARHREGPIVSNN